MPSTNQSHPHVVPWRRLLLLLLLVAALVISLAVGSITTHKSKWMPEFALDLQGGTQIILTPKTTDGSTVTDSDVKQAIEIIRQRVDASGVAEAEITSQGGSNIVVGLPGTPSQETLNLVRTSAVLRMRPVLQMANPGVLTPAQVEQMNNPQAQTDSSDQSAQDSAQASSADSEAESSTAAESTEENTDQAQESESTDSQKDESSSSTEKSEQADSRTYSQEELKAEAMKIADANGDGTLSDEPATKPSDASDLNWITEQAVYDSLVLDCTSGKARPESDDPEKPLVACDPESGMKYILGPAEVEGTEISKATSGFNQQKNLWVVGIEFNRTGTKEFAEVTKRLVSLEQPRNMFASVLDGNIITAASVNEPITGGNAEISGSFTADQVQTLANQLNFGSLPLQFEVQSEEQISATLGSESLRSGLIAGLIGLVLVVLYLLWQYHGLGFVAAGSVVIATALSYLLVSLLSWTMGYRLSMAGVVGLIISVGITADSFIVFFERIRDEIREGRTLKAAVSHGWHRAKRTIIVADGVNLLCSVVLYFLAVGSVRGFAFTLGLTTVIDLLIVMMFTYPVMTLLVRTRFFGEGRRFSGMDPRTLGHTPAYRGRVEAVKGLSLAERKAQERKAAAAQNDEKEKPAESDSAKEGDR